MLIASPVGWKLYTVQCSLAYFRGNSLLLMYLHAPFALPCFDVVWASGISPPGVVWVRGTGGTRHHKIRHVHFHSSNVVRFLVNEAHCDPNVMNNIYSGVRTDSYSPCLRLSVVITHYCYVCCGTGGHWRHMPPHY